ncbi:MAG: hypothetical protein AAFN63_19110 [Pseudomonadota bacterium]
MFLPAYGPEGAALLRIYRIAEALRGQGWRTLVLPWRLTLAQRQRFLRRVSPDVVVMQGARHALNRPALYPDQRILFDMDDADFHLPHLAGPVRDAMGQVAGVIAGSRYIAEWCRAAGAPRVDVVWTGAPVTRPPAPPQTVRPPVVAWAQTRPMTYVGEAAWVRDVITRLGAARPGVTLRLFDRQPGDDPGFAATFDAPGVTVEWQPALPYKGFLRALEDVAVGLAPLAPDAPFSRGKSFGKILGYLDRQVPVLASDAGEPAAFFTVETGVLSNAVDVWSQEAKRLLEDADARQTMAAAASDAFEAQLSVAASARAMDRVLRAAIN